jgi:hypothetical protein
MMSLRPPMRSGKQIRDGLGFWGSKSGLSQDASSNEALRLPGMAAFCGFGPPPMPEAAVDPLQYAFCCFPHASPISKTGAGTQKRPRRVVLKSLKILRDFGAGEGIRTLDPNLGKVVLYP